MKRVIIEYYQKLYANKLNNSDEMYKSLKDTNYQNSLKKKNNGMAKKSIKKPKFIVKNLSNKKSPGSEAFTGGVRELQDVGFIGRHLRVSLSHKWCSVVSF